MKNNNDKYQGIDLITPLVEVLYEVTIMTGKMVALLVQYLWRKKFPNMKIEKVDFEKLNTTKSTDCTQSLGIDTKSKRKILLSEIDFRRHTFIVGATGFGKTNLITILQEYSLQSKRPIIFFDPKADAGAILEFQKLCGQYKRPCLIFSERYKDSIKLNPFKKGTISQIADRIISAYNWESDYYKTESHRTLIESLEKLKQDDKKFTLKTIYDQVLALENKDNNGIIGNLCKLIKSDFGPLLCDEEGLGLEEIRSQNSCLYIGLSTQGYGQMAVALGKIILGELLFNSYDRLGDFNDPESGLKQPISVYFDEFGSIVTAEFIELQNKCRGAGIELTMAVQTPSDIDRVNPDLTKQVIENCGNIFIFKQRLDSSASFFAETIGTIAGKKHTYVTEDGETMARGSVREVNELIVHPDIIKNQKIGQCILLTQAPRARIHLVNVRNRKTDLTIKLNQHPQIKKGALSMGG